MCKKRPAALKAPPAFDHMFFARQAATSALTLSREKSFAGPMMEASRKVAGSISAFSSPIFTSGGCTAFHTSGCRSPSRLVVE